MAPSVQVRSRIQPSPRAEPGGAGGRVSSARLDLVSPNSSSSIALYLPSANRISVTNPAPVASVPASAGGSIGSSHGGSGATAAFAPFESVAASNPGEATGAPPLFVPPSGSPGGHSSGMAAQAKSTTTAGTPSTGSITAPQSVNSNVATTNSPFATLNVYAGQVIYPGATQLATLGGKVELRAQLKNASSASFSWNTSGLTKATAITGANTADLKFQWTTSNSVATTNSATLSVTSGGVTTSQTYTFQVPTGSGATAGTGTRSWPQVISPDLVSASAPAMGVQDGSVDANSGAFNTTIALPSYNPNVPAVTLAYDSVTANPRPIFAVHHTLDASLATPTQVTARLTFNGTAGATAYTNTSQLIPGDVQRIGLQANAASLATGRYTYSVTTGDVRSSITTATVSGSANLVNSANSAIGSGWTVAGLEKIVAASGGVMLDLGSGGKSLWFATGSGSTYTSPAGEFSTLVANSGGTYTRTFTNGFKIQFNSSGQETAALNTNGVGDSFAYNGNGSLNTITDTYGGVTTFAYSGGLLASITDPANRVTSFNHSGTALTGATLPDNSTWTYAANVSGLITTVTDPNNHAVTVGYDAAGRVGTINNPDSTSQSLTNVQESGLVASGASSAGSPVAPFLLTEAGASMTDPLGHTISLQTDWQGLGLTDVAIDALGQISTVNRDGNGLALTTVDPMNRITQHVYDAAANVTKTTSADGTTRSATYNSLAEPLTITDPLSRVLTMTYDAKGNRLTDQDPLGNTITYTYSSTGQINSITHPPINSGGGGGGGAKGPVSNLATFSQAIESDSYDSHDLKQSSTTNNQTTNYSYNSAGYITSTTDALNHVTTTTYDAMGRVLAVTDPLNHQTTFTYDKLGNRTGVTDALNHTTTTAFDAMNRPTTVTDPRGAVTTFAYDNAGNLASITDPVGNKTSYAYDAANRLKTITDPFGNATTLTLNPDGEITSRLDRNGRTTNYTYDPMGRVLNERWMNGSTALNTITHTYDLDGETTRLADTTTSLTHTYDADGNALTVATGGSAGQPAVTLTSTYGPEHFRTGLADGLSSAGSISYTYDAAQRLTKIASTYGGSAGPQVALTYDAANQLTGQSRTIGGSGTAINSTFAYDPANRLTAITHGVAGGATLAGYSYGYDLANRLTSDTNAEGTANYTYDNSNELTGTTGSRSETYSYDANGNRTMAGYTTGTNNQLTAGAGYTYTYDREQNLVSKTQTATGNKWTYTWDYRNRLTGVVEKNSAGATLVQGSYTYDALDRRIVATETVGGATTTTATVYDGVNPYADFNGSGTLLTRYMTAGGYNSYLTRIAASGTVAWYLSDHQGSIRDLASTSGSVIDHVAYDSYGNVRSESGPSNGDRFKFDGMAWDAAIGEYYDNARYYDANLGRFISQDPTGFSAGDMNLSRFASNDTTNFVGQSGLAGKYIKTPKAIEDLVGEWVIGEGGTSYPVDEILWVFQDGAHDEGGKRWHAHIDIGYLSDGVEEKGRGNIVGGKWVPLLPDDVPDSPLVIPPPILTAPKPIPQPAPATVPSGPSWLDVLDGILSIPKAIGGRLFFPPMYLGPYLDPDGPA